MAYLMEMGFDNGGRLERNTYVFEYAGVQFKLVQDHPRKHADHLMTILLDNKAATKQRAYAAASEFSAALAWQNRTAVALHESGGRGWSPTWPLRRARPSIFTFPKIAFGGYRVGCSLSTLPTIENEKQRLALALFGEATASNNAYLSLLFHWQVLSVAGDPEAVADRIFRRKGRHSLQLSASDLAVLPLAGRSLGAYLRVDCRNAIAHIIRRPGGRRIVLGDLEDRIRIVHSARVVRALARDCIVSELGLKKESFLVRVQGSTIPKYVDEDVLMRGGFWYKPAYAKKYKGLVFPSPRGGRPRTAR